MFILKPAHLRLSGLNNCCKFNFLDVSYNVSPMWKNIVIQLKKHDSSEVCLYITLFDQQVLKNVMSQSGKGVKINTQEKLKVVEARAVLAGN